MEEKVKYSNTSDENWLKLYADDNYVLIVMRIFAWT